MPDMLVKLYELPCLTPVLEQMNNSGLVVRQALPPEKHLVTEWVKKNFSPAWASECEVAFSNKPVSCFIAVKGNTLMGFACYEATCRNFFGPIGTAEEARGLGVGKGLLLASLHAMREMGYGYAIIGGAGPVEFFSKTAGASVIENSSPGIYRGMLRQKKAKA